MRSAPAWRMFARSSSPKLSQPSAFHRSGSGGGRPQFCPSRVKESGGAPIEKPLRRCAAPRQLSQPSGAARTARSRQKPSERPALRRLSRRPRELAFAQPLQILMVADAAGVFAREICQRARFAVAQRRGPAPPVFKAAPLADRLETGEAKQASPPSAMKLSKSCAGRAPGWA